MSAWRPTRYPELGYRQDAPGVWRIVDTDGGKSIGPYYRTRVELLCDLDGFARGRGIHDGVFLPNGTPDVNGRTDAP